MSFKDIVTGVVLFSVFSAVPVFASEAELDAIAEKAKTAKTDTELVALMTQSCMLKFKDSEGCGCFTLAITSTTPTVPQLRVLADHFSIDRMREYAADKAPMSDAVMQRLGTCFR